MSGGQRLRGDKRVWSGFGGKKTEFAGEKGEGRRTEKKEMERLWAKLSTCFCSPFFPLAVTVERYGGYADTRVSGHGREEARGPAGIVW